MSINNFLTRTFVRPTLNDEYSADNTADAPETLTVHRLDYPAWIKSQEMEYSCKFYNKTGGGKMRRDSNKSFLSNGCRHLPPPKRARGQSMAFFTEVIHVTCKYDASFIEYSFVIYRPITVAIAKQDVRLAFTRMYPTML